MREHGTLSSFTIDKCRCDPCKAASRRYEQRRNRLMAYGQWQPYVDAEPVRQHVKRLQEYGLGWPRIADLSGVPRGSMSKLLYGDGARGMAPSKRVRPKTAAALLALEPNLDVLGATILVDAAGTHRRVRALVTMGWSLNRIAKRVGVERANFGKTMRLPRLRASTARAVRDVYDELWNQPPPEGTHQEKIAASRARNHAKARGWLPPMAWDEDLIDLPAAELKAELARRVSAMDDGEIARCYSARRRDGERSPLFVEAAREYDRRRHERAKAA